MAFPVDPINASKLLQEGRVQVQDKPVEPAKRFASLNYAVETLYVFHLPSVVSENVFGIPKSLFLDNSSNPNPIEVQVSGTDQFFVAPAGSSGYYNLDAQGSSDIELYSLGGATDLITVTLYNFIVAPIVWYGFGPLDPAKPLSVRGEDGLTIMSVTNPFAVGGQIKDGFALNLALDRPVFVAGIDRATGLAHGLKVDASGALSVASSFVPTDNATSVITSVADNIADTLLLASNATRAGASIYNNSNADMYVALAVAVSPISFTTKIQAGGYYEVPANYSGAIHGIWTAALGGAALITEITP